MAYNYITESHGSQPTDMLDPKSYYKLINQFNFRLDMATLYGSTEANILGYLNDTRVSTRCKMMTVHAAYLRLQLGVFL